MLQEATRNSSSILLNGERLLGFSAAELRSWTPERPLPAPAELAAPEPLLAALTTALLSAQPELSTSYEGLDQRCERGGAPAEQSYGERLQTIDSNGLVTSWNRQLERHQAEDDLELVRLQLLDMEQECERQFLTSRDTAARLSYQRQLTKQATGGLQHYGRLLRRLQQQLARLQ